MLDNVIEKSTESTGALVNYSLEDHGKCGTCGLLAKRSDLLDTYYEVPYGQRQNPSDLLFKHITSLAASSIPVRIVCFVLEPLSEEIHSDQPSTAAVAFNRERKCPKWYGYVQGYTPLSHLKRYDMEQLEQRRREFELKLFSMSQKVQEDSRSIAEDSKKIAEENRRIAEASKSIAKWIGIVVIAFMLVQILLAVLTYRTSARTIVVTVPVQQQQSESLQQPTEKK